MFRHTLFAAVIALMGFFARAEDIDNPYKSSKVGDWVEYTSHTEMTGFKMDSKIKQTVTAKTEKEATVKLDMDMNGQKNSQEIKIDLTKQYDPTTNGMPPGMKATVEKGKEGDETLTVGGKSYKTHFVENKINIDTGAMKMENNSKVWTCKEVPVGGMVKMENSMSNGMKMTMELTATGNDGK